MMSVRGFRNEFWQKDPWSTKKFRFAGEASRPLQSQPSGPPDLIHADVYPPVSRRIRDESVTIPAKAQCALPGM